MYDPATATWYLRNEDSPGPADAGVFQFGAPGWIPVVGDWNGSGKTGIGVIDPATMTWYLRDSSSPGAPDITPFRYGGVGWKPVAGDWGGGGRAGIGVFDPSGTWYLRDTASAGRPNVAPFAYGLGGWTPLAGAYLAPAQALLAAGGAGAGGGALSEPDLLGAVRAALVRLQAAGAGPVLLGYLAAAKFVVAPLGGAVLGQISAGHAVEISATAAGHGWFVDPTPGQDEEFGGGTPLLARPGGPAAGKMDLLTAVLDEMGQLAGAAGDPTADMLAPGVRRVDVLDRLFASWE
jgi:hypothetical protein